MDRLTSDSTPVVGSALEVPEPERGRPVLGQPEPERPSQESAPLALTELGSRPAGWAALKELAQAAPLVLEPERD